MPHGVEIVPDGRMDPHALGLHAEEQGEQLGQVRRGNAWRCAHIADAAVGWAEPSRHRRGRGNAIATRGSQCLCPPSVDGGELGTGPQVGADREVAVELARGDAPPLRHVLQ